jgi:hypothetical protein
MRSGDAGGDDGRMHGWPAMDLTASIWVAIVLAIALLVARTPRHR